MPVLLGLYLLEAVYIILLLLNEFEESHSAELIGSDFSLFKLLDYLVLQHKAIITWDMLRSWTGINLDKLVRSKINTLENAILMCCEQHIDFGHFKWYLNKDIVCCLLNSISYWMTKNWQYPNNPNKYKA